MIKDLQQQLNNIFNAYIYLISSCVVRFNFTLFIALLNESSALVINNVNALFNIPLTNRYMLNFTDKANRRAN